MLKDCTFKHGTLLAIPSSDEPYVKYGLRICHSTLELIEQLGNIESHPMKVLYVINTKFH